MALATALIGIGLGISAVGTVAGISAQGQANKAQKRAMDIQQRQAELESQRSRRQVYRDMVKAQAMSETAAASSGGIISSSLQGGLAQASNSAMQSDRDIGQNLQNSRDLYRTRRSAVGLGDNASMLRDIGSGLTSLGGSNFIKTMSLFNKV